MTCPDNILTQPDVCAECGEEHNGTKDICNHCIEAFRESEREDRNRDR